MKTQAKASVVTILREQERQRQLKFWNLLIENNGNDEAPCPTRAEAPQDAVYFGIMPRHLRDAFVKSVHLHENGHAGEARALDAAVSDLLQGHFKEQLRRKETHGESPVAEFRVTKDWHIYAIAFSH